jgi:uncharacterized protein (DUF1919 family)
VGDLILRFQHDDNFSQAKTKWDVRKKLFNYENVFVLTSFSASPSEKILKEFEALPFENKCLFVRKKSKSHACTFSIPQERAWSNPSQIVGNRSGWNPFSWLSRFDIVSFLNTGTIRAYPLSNWLVIFRRLFITLGKKFCHI